MSGMEDTASISSPIRPERRSRCGTRPSAPRKNSDAASVISRAASGVPAGVRRSVPALRPATAKFATRAGPARTRSADGSSDTSTSSPWPISTSKA